MNEWTSEYFHWLNGEEGQSNDLQNYIWHLPFSHASFTRQKSVTALVRVTRLPFFFLPRCRCRCRWVLSIFLVKIKLPSLILQQWKSWGEKSNCTKGVSNSQKKGEAPFHPLWCYMETKHEQWNKGSQLLMLTPIKTPAPQAGLLRKETWES